MPTTKPSTVKKRKTPSKADKREAQVSAVPTRRVPAFLRRPYEKVRGRVRSFLIRRPHRSFRRTYRRDYVRSLKLPGYWALTNQVRRLIWSRKKLFLLLVLTYALMSGLLVGIGSQTTYEQLSSTLQTTGGDIFQGNWGKVGQASLLLTTALSNGLNGELSDVQKVYSGIVILLAWLTTVWLLRAVMAGRKPRLRDGIYNAGAPIVPTFLVGLALIVQLLPFALAVIVIGAASPAGALEGGLLSMLVWIGVALLVVLSLYWVTSTFFALIVVTLPGMYPYQAIKTAGDLVIGRRVRVLLRLLWLLFTLVVLWAVVMIPVILLDAWLKGVWPVLEPAPIVPIALLLMTSATVVWAASYVYVFYRKVVEDDSAPA